MTSFTELFGGSTLQAADVSFSSIAMTGDLDTFWPPAAVGANQPLPRLANVTADGAGYTFSLPDARQVSTGQDFFFFNTGAESIIVATFAGVPLATVAPGEQRYFYLTDNSTAGGGWTTILMGAGASALDASALAGYGLVAQGSTLNASLYSATFSADTTFNSGDRAHTYVNTGGAVTATLPDTTALNVGNSFFMVFRNQGTGVLTLDPYAAQTIDGAASLALNVGEACLLVAGVGTWYTIGLGRNAKFIFTQLLKTVTGGTDVLTLSEAYNVVQTYSGTLLSDETVVLPSVVQVYYVSNQTAGAYTFTLQTATPGTTVVLQSGENAVVFCDGVNVINAATLASLGVLGAGSAGSPSLAIGASNNGLFAPSSTQIAVSANGVEAVRWDSGQTQVPSGTAGLPAYTFKLYPTTGAYIAGPNMYGVATNGVKRLVVDASGNVGLGPEVLAGNTGFNLSKDITGGVVSYGTRSVQTLASGVTSYATGFYTSLSTTAAAFTVADLVYYRAYQGTVGAGSAITRQAAFKVDSNFTGAASNFGFYGDIPTGANRWNAYMAGTAPNYFGGFLLAGTLTANAGGAKLQTADGLTFPATDVPSSDPNTLDDYEEGVWTPVVYGTSSAGVGTYSYQSGTYTKIGRLVFINGAIGWTAHTGTGNLRMSGLPFAADVTVSNIIGLQGALLTTATTGYSFLGSCYSTNVYMYQTGLTGPYSEIAVPGTGQLDFTGVFQV